MRFLQYIKGCLYFVLGFVAVWINKDPLLSFITGVITVSVVEFILYRFQKNKT